MSSARVPIDGEELVRHAGFVRRLARDLVAGGLDADDVAQQTCLAALERPPRRPGPLAPWLRAVARNVARRLGRSRTRRARHEAAAPPPRDSASPLASAERAETVTALARAVAALEEPYRTAVLLRYYDGLPPREVAARTGAPVETVRTRLKRALAALRADLDGREGRRSWFPALSALGGDGSPAAPTAAATGGLAMATGAKVLIGTVAVALAAGLVVLATHAARSARGAAPVPGAEVAKVTDASPTPAPVLEGRATAADLSQRSSRDVDAEIAVLFAQVEELKQQAAWMPVDAEEVRKVIALRGPVPPRTVEVLVLDGLQPFPGVRVGLSGGKIDTQSQATRSVDADGRFRAADLTVDAARTWDALHVLVEAPGEEPRSTSIVVHENRDSERVVLRYGHSTIDGIVRDEAGRPLAGAWVPVEYMGPFEACNTFGITVQTDASGRFAVRRLPDGRYRVGANPTADDGEPAGWERTTAYVAGDDTLSLELGASPDTPRIEGRVVSASGAPVAGPGWVLLTKDGERDGDEVEMRLDGAGRFRRRLPAGVYRARVLPAGYPYPSPLDVPGTVDVAAEGSTVEITLPGVRVEGRVLDDATGLPITDAEVHVVWRAKETQDVNPWRTVPAPGGVFACDGLLPGEVYVFRLQPLRLARDDGEEGFEVTLGRDETLRKIELRAER